MVLVLVVGIECLAWLSVRIFQIQPLMAMGVFRLVQVLAMIMVLGLLENGLGAIGWAPSGWIIGLRQGMVWSIGFGLAAGIVSLVVYLFGVNPLRMIQAPLPHSIKDLIVFFMVGGLIAPVAEELYFRGIIYTFFRRWGIIASLTVSTSLFVALHSVSGIPVTQVVGGIVFALAYENSKNLMVPMVIHVAGNLAIFCLSLPGIFTA